MYSFLLCIRSYYVLIFLYLCAIFFILLGTHFLLYIHFHYVGPTHLFYEQILILCIHPFIM